jgi:ankyrin repeat protein
MGAADGGHDKLVQVLLARGANVLAANHEKATAITYAERNGHTKVVELLRKSAPAPRAMSRR